MRRCHSLQKKILKCDSRRATVTILDVPRTTQVAGKLCREQEVFLAQVHLRTLSSKTVDASPFDLMGRNSIESCQRPQGIVLFELESVLKGSPLREIDFRCCRAKYSERFSVCSLLDFGESEPYKL